MNINQIQKQYDKLTAPERFALLCKAAFRDDQTEAQALRNSAPKKTFRVSTLKGLLDGFQFLAMWHAIQQLGCAATFQMLAAGDFKVSVKLPNGESATAEDAMNKTAQRFLEGAEAYTAVCAEYGVDPDEIGINLYSEILAFTELIMRVGYAEFIPELTDLENTKQAYREVIEYHRKEWE